MPSFPSLNALFPWFKRPMEPNWQIVLKRTLSSPTDSIFQHYISAAKEAADPQSLVDRLDVVWVWQLKENLQPFHEAAVVETEDRLDNNVIRAFVLDCVYRADGTIERAEVTEIALGNDQKPSSSPPVSIPTPPLSAKDSATLVSVQSSHKIAESMNKNGHTEALDRILGEAFVARFDNWKCVRQFKPRGLKFFDFIFLAHTVHLEAPTYTALKDNCYWYVTTVLDAIEAHCGVVPPTSHEDTRRQTRYSFDPELTGRWNGLKITASNPNQISVIVSKYKEARTEQMLKIKAPSQLLFAADQYRETVRT